MATPPREEQPRKQQPSSSAFKQQRLPAWQPILTAGTVLPTFFVIGLAFIPIGIGLLASSNDVQEFQLDYTYCTNDLGEVCADLIAQKPGPCICKMNFTLSDNFKAEVFMYYGLTNYYQNHRRYVKSRDDHQLLGDTSGKLTGDCDPFAYEMINGTKIPYAPCGAIANSLFNDTLELYHVAEGNYKRVPLLKTGIAWATDKNAKFRNPPGANLSEAFAGTAKPPNWPQPVWMLDTDESNNGYLNEDLIVWMRTAALPTFRKLYRRINHDVEGFRNNLPSGVYMLNVTYNYPVTSFKGTKRIILSNTSWLGGKNPFLGIAYIVVGSICLILAVVFLVIHNKFGKSTHDLINITPRTPY